MHAIADRVDGLGAEAQLHAVRTVLEVDAVVLLVGGGRDGAGRLGVRDDEEAVRADFSGQRDGDVARAAVAVDADEHEALERRARRSHQLDEDLGVGAVGVVAQLVEHHLRRRRLGLADAIAARLRDVAVQALANSAAQSSSGREATGRRARGVGIEGPRRDHDAEPRTAGGARRGEATGARRPE